MVLFFVGVIIFSLIIIIYNLITRKNNYWKKKKVPHLKPSFLFGNYKDYILLKKSAPQVAQGLSDQFSNLPYFGTYYGTEPALVITDPELLSLVFTKDFYHFSGREVSKYSDKEFVTQSLFFIGEDKWKIARNYLTPMFTATKMKNMFYLIVNSCESLENVTKQKIESSKTIDVKDLMSQYTIDCMCSCVFGINTGVLGTNSENHPFMNMGKKIFMQSTIGGLIYMCRAIWPSVFYRLGFKQYDDELCKFFNEFLTKIFREREKEQIVRNDFIDQLLEWKRNNSVTGTGLRKNSKELVTIKVNDELLVGECVLFFGAGFDTTAVTMMFVLYELSKNKDIQSKVIEEVDDYFKKFDGKIQYECINQLPYIEACISETLRLYPLLGLLTREVMHDYTFPDGLTVEKGTRIHIPVYHIHNNPKLFPNPEIFRPERFLGEEKKKITRYSYLAFGEGARICLGIRFAYMMMYPCLLTIFKNYEVEISPDTPRRVNFDPKAFNTKPIDDLNVKFIPRS